MRTLMFFASGVENWPVERSGIPHLAKDERDMGHHGHWHEEIPKQIPFHFPVGRQRRWMTDKKQVLDYASMGVWHGRKHHE